MSGIPNWKMVLIRIGGSTIVVFLSGNKFFNIVSIQEIQQELHAKEGAVESIRLHAHKLLQGVGGAHVNASAIHSRLDNVGKRWDHLQTLARDRYVYFYKLWT